MKQRLLWKLLLINSVPVIGVILLVVWLAIDQLAAKYFMALMNRYEINPSDIHQMFLASIHRYLIWASLAALVLAFVISYLLTRRLLRPLSQMAAISRALAAGDFSARVEVTSGDEVGQLGLAFNRMTDSLERIEQLRKNMVADVAHELRTPLTNLRGYVEALTDEVLPPARETFELLQQEIMRLVKLVDNLQQLARAEAAHALLKLEKLSLPDLIEQLLPLYHPMFWERQITISTDFPAEAVEITADRDKLLQALRNLLENGAKYTPPGGWLRIATSRIPAGIRVTFSNNGPGIAAADLPYIFERFFRADRSRSRDAGGAGIGLAIVKQLIEAHGGQVGAASSAAETSIWFTLPG
jgi:two-component system, OmpR family, sensor histidine kinase BaeS